MVQFQGKGLVCVRGERDVFHGLDFSANSGDAMVLTGRNGSGKSSLLRILAGLLPPRHGTLTWDGEAVTEEADAHRARLHYVGHLDAVKPVLTVSENLSHWAALRGGTDDIHTALETFGIGHLAEVSGRFLSAGQKRRVNLARLVANRAEIWLLDEPTTALDKETITVLMDMIKAHRADGGMVFVSTHTDLDLGETHDINLDDFKPPLLTDSDGLDHDDTVEDLAGDAA